MVIPPWRRWAMIMQALAKVTLLITAIAALLTAVATLIGALQGI